MSIRESLDLNSARKGECTIWLGAVEGSGYGVVRDGGRRMGAHRASWELANGPIPEGLLVDHMCWNRLCVNVDHLRLATRAENGAYRSGAASSSKTGVRGVFLTDTGRYRAQYRKNGKKVSVGRFDTLEEAEVAIEMARREAFGDFAGQGKAPDHD